jgi:hypothetical protein
MVMAGKKTGWYSSQEDDVLGSMQVQMWAEWAKISASSDYSLALNQLDFVMKTSYPVKYFDEMSARFIAAEASKEYHQRLRWEMADDLK